MLVLWLYKVKLSLEEITWYLIWALILIRNSPYINSVLQLFFQKPCKSRVHYYSKNTGLSWFIYYFYIEEFYLAIFGTFGKIHILFLSVNSILSRNRWVSSTGYKIWSILYQSAIISIFQNDTTIKLLFNVFSQICETAILDL